MTFLDRPDDEKWIFLSHSNADFEKVRLIRNHLEEKRCRPLMFYLKCLNSDEELFDLIKREIDARTRFVVCDSDNARLSKWVRKEIEYITSTEPKRSFLRLDLSKPVEELNRAVDSYILQMNLFISCLRKDESVVNVAKKRLGKYDLSIFKVDMLPAGCDYASYIRERMAKIIDSGFFVILVTNCPVSSWQKKELDFALKTAVTYLFKK